MSGRVMNNHARPPTKLRRRPSSAFRNYLVGLFHTLFSERNGLQALPILISRRTNPVLIILSMWDPAVIENTILENIYPKSEFKLTYEAFAPLFGTATVEIIYMGTDETTSVPKLVPKDIYALVIGARDTAFRPYELI